MMRTVAAIAMSAGLVAGSASVSAHTHTHKQPSEVFQSVSSKVSALESRLSEMEVENKAKLAARLTKYQAKLSEKQKANEQLAREIAGLSTKASELDKGNHDLQKHAQQLQKDNLIWENDWKALQSNISTALELASHTILGINKDRSAKELAVLDELQELDEHERKQAVHRHQLNEVAMPGLLESHAGMGHFSLLATQSASSPNPRSLLKILDAGLEDLHKEYKDSEAALDAKYAGLFGEQDQKHDDLHMQQVDLNAKIVSLLKLKERVELAVKHLEESNKELEKKAMSLRMYAQRLGIRALPRQHGSDSSGSSVSSATSASKSRLRRATMNDGDAVVAAEAELGAEGSDAPSTPRTVESMKDAKRAFLSWMR